MEFSKNGRVLVVGGAGYVGAVLVPKLLDAGYKTTVLDWFIYGDDVFGANTNNPNLRMVKGDMRDMAICQDALKDVEAVIHLACISNDPSFELNPDLGKSINYDCFAPFVKMAKAGGVKRFVYASSSSVYGIKETANVTEDLSLEPLTDYSKFKAMCEEVLMAERAPGFVTLILRPATVCGYSPRLRLDLTVNILTNHAVNKNKITVFGGTQLRPNINIQDMTDLYVKTLEYPDDIIDGKIFNAGYENHSLNDIAAMVRDVVGPVEVTVESTNDMRSYHVSSDKIARELGFQPKYTIRNAVESLVDAFKAGKISDPMNDNIYYNVKRMQALGIQ